METILVPLINANERELELSEVHVTEGQQVTQGQLLFVVESTKASLDVEAPRAGYVRRLTAQPGQRLLVGAPLCVLSDAPDSALPAPDAAADGDADGARVTRKARALAEAHGLDLALLRVDGIIKTEHVQAALDARAGATARPALGAPQQVVVWGGGGHARALVDLIRAARPDLHLLCAVDAAAQPAADVLGVPIRGTSADLPRLRADGAQHAALGIGAVTNNSARADLFARLDGHGFSLPSWVHRRAIVEPSARMGRGCQIFPGAVVGSNVQLGDNVIVNSGVVLSHDCVIGDHTHLTPGAILAGNVTIGRSCVIGMGVTIYLGVTIGDNVTIANGAHVLRDVPPNTLVKP